MLAWVFWSDRRRYQRIVAYFAGRAARDNYLIQKLQACVGQPLEPTAVILGDEGGG
jgi:hypothetical protein